MKANTEECRAIARGFQQVGDGAFADAIENLLDVGESATGSGRTPDEEMIVVSTQGPASFETVTSYLKAAARLLGAAQELAEACMGDDDINRIARALTETTRVQGRAQESARVALSDALDGVYA